MNNKAFTLIELLLAMAIMGILAIMLIGNFNSTLMRGRDAQRKNDLNQLQKALEVYYEENQKYPTFTDIFGKKLCISTTVASTSPCPANETVYMVKTPKDPSSSYTYRYIPNAAGSSYYLYSYIENSLDQGSGVSATGFTTMEKCDTAVTNVNCRYFAGSSNAATLSPNP